MNNKADHTEIIGLDIGVKKVGVARMSMIAKLPQPIGVFGSGQELMSALRKIMAEYDSSLIVSGLPRSMQGKETQQTVIVRTKAEQVASDLGLPLRFQDETLSTVRANDYIRRHKLQQIDDAIAACIILEDFADDNDQMSEVQ